MEYKDYMVRATAGNAQIRAFAATTKDLADYGRRAHGLSPIAAAALGRLMTGTVIMGAMMDNEGDLITVRMEGDGPLKSVLATADTAGNVKGYVGNPYVIMEPNADGHLNVGGGIGEGTLTVIKDMGVKEPYVGQVAVGAVVLNRVQHPSFPGTIAGVIYQSGAFSCIADGQFNQPVASSAYRAADDALNGWDPTGGAIYYFNPATATSAWIWSRPLILTIGKHRFCA